MARATIPRATMPRATVTNEPASKFLEKHIVTFVFVWIACKHPHATGLGLLLWKIRRFVFRKIQRCYYISQYADLSKFIFIQFIVIITDMCKFLDLSYY